MTTTADRPETGQSGYKVVGTRPIRHDGLDKVTGRARYGADVVLPDMLHGKVLRSPYAHARIRSIDTSKAEALPGVKAVVTGRDFPILEDKIVDFGETQGNNRLWGENLLARDKVLYKGHAIAAVAATSPHIAEEALALIEIEYEPLPVLLNVFDAMKDGAPLIHEDLTTWDVKVRFVKGTDTGVKSNVASFIKFERGDLEEGFRQADEIIEREFTTKTVHQGYIEPHTGAAYWSADGHLTVWSSSQGAFGVRGQTAAIVGLPESRVKVIPMEIGGGFGGKLSTYLDPVAAILSKKSARPVKIVMSRADCFEASGPTSGTYMRCKIGADKSGHITAAHLYLAYEAGAYPGSPVGAGVSTGLAPYNIDNLLAEGYDVIVNKPKVAAYRAPGSPQAAFAVESVIDELAEKLGMDSLDFRLKNATKEGDRLPSGVQFPRVGHIEVLEAMKSSEHYKSKLEGPNRGRGVAVGFWGNAGNNSSATINVNSDGTISLITGSVDIGGQRASLAMQAAEVLGIAAEAVSPAVGDTDSVGWTGQTGGSRTTFSTGLAVIAAAEDVKQQMIERAARLWEGQPEDVELKDGVFVSKKNPDVKMTFKELASRLQRSGGPVTASHVSNPRQVGPAFAGQIFDVELDPDTGKINVLRATVVQDVGTAIHPSYVEGQMQGATVQGIGWALNEEYVYRDDGVMANSSFLDYRMPTSLDVPMIETVLVEVPNPGHPFGVRGVGEVSIVPPMAAMANAVYRATGKRMPNLPMSPGAILESIGATSPEG